MNQRMSDMEAIESGLSYVIAEFGNVFAADIPDEDRNEVVRAAALSWLSEKMTCAVQRKTKYQDCQNIERANNVVRFGHGFIVRAYDGKYPYMPAILEKD
jgi:hypothetical protein